MKIIATVDTSKVIVEMTTDELAKLMGKRYDSRLEKDQKQPGYVFAIDERFHGINEIATIPKTVAGVKKSLTDALKQIELAEKATEKTEFSLIKHRD